MAEEQVSEPHMPAPSSAGPLRLLLVDDHPVFRRGLREMLSEEESIEVVGEAGTGEEAIAAVRRLLPKGLDLVLMDLEMKGMSGLEATRRLLAEYPDLSVVLLTASSEEEDLLDAMEAGALGYLTKSITLDAMVRALRDYQREGSLLMSRKMAARVLHHLRRSTRLRRLKGEPAELPAQSRPPPRGMTAREWEVLELVAQGKSDSEIAKGLVLSLGTVKKHVENIRQKLGVRNRVEAARWLWEQRR